MIALFVAAKALKGLAARMPLLPSAAILILLLNGAFVYSQGVTMASDSVRYDDWSIRLVESGFDYSLLAEANTEFPAELYALFATLVGLLRLASGDDWPLSLVVLNLLTHIALGVMVLSLVVRTTGSAVAGWAALLLYLGCYDLLMWVPFVLSDSTFVALAFTTFSLAAARILGTARGWLPVLIPAAAGVFYRPTGIVLLPDLVLAISLATRRRAITRPRLCLTVAAGALVVAATLFAWIVQEPSRWPLTMLFDAFQAAANHYDRGEVIGGRPETYHPPPQALLDFVKIWADRFLHFFAIGATGYSLAHWLVSLGFYLPCYALSGWLLVALWRGDTAFGPAERKVFLAAAGAVLAYAYFHALILLDFDWRYRVPILPHLILLAGGGVADLVRRVKGHYGVKVSSVVGPHGKPVRRTSAFHPFRTLAERLLSTHCRHSHDGG